MKSNNKGFTLAELIVVIAILAVLTIMSVPRFNSYLEKTKEQVCNVNTRELDRMYHAHLLNEGIHNTEDTFGDYYRKYGQSICPKDGIISYYNEQVMCSIHFRAIENEDEVPYL